MNIKECCTLLVDGNWIETKDQSESGIRLVQTGNIGNGEYLEKENRAKYISEDTFNRLNCIEIFPGDILVSRLPDPVGRACLIPEKKERMITAVDCSILRVDESKINKRYLLHFLKSSRYYQQISEKLVGATRLRISRKNLEQVKIEVPDKAKQEYIVAVIDKLEQVIQLRKQELRLL
ncbi:MAG: restriction endonuclease subunit S, partial [Proteobacteria bacterium]|nr:restriction endonuclease subunit S [Pseudomonadota bacterium]